MIQRRSPRIVLAAMAIATAPTLYADAGAAATTTGGHATLEHRLTTTRPNAPTGTTYTGSYHARGNTGGDPPYLRMMRFHLPAGMRYDTSVPGRCTASDLELSVRGAAACPEDSRVGGGQVRSKFLGSPNTLEVDVLNNTNEMIMVARSPFLSSVTRGRILPDGSTEFRAPTCFPQAAGCPVDTALQLGSSVTIPPLTGRSGSYLVTPRSCPRSRRWRGRVRFSWADGSEETVRTTYRCMRPRSRARR